MKIGTRVRIKSTSTSFYHGREGVVVEFDPKLKWASSPRAQLCPEQCICVHMIPKSARERKHGSPLAMLFPEELAVLSNADSSSPSTRRGNRWF